MAEAKRIGVMTTGGDCAGLNAVIRAVVTRAVGRKGNVVPRVTDSTDTATLDAFVRDSVCTKVSRKHLPLYVAEFQLSYNNRQSTDIFGAAVGQC